MEGGLHNHYDNNRMDDALLIALLGKNRVGSVRRITRDRGLTFTMVEQLKQKPNSLEYEKEDFVKNMVLLVDSMDFEDKQKMGRPRADPADIMKSLLIMAYHGFSYRRAESDIRKLHEESLIKCIPKRSTLNRYMISKDTGKVIQGLIQFSSLAFINDEDTIILDSTWVATRMYVGGCKNKIGKFEVPLKKCRKIHIACLKNSKIIPYAIVSDGTCHDSPFFQELIMGVIRIGFNINFLLADAGYLSRKNYAFCRNMNIKAYIDFRKTSKLHPRRSKTAWRKALEMLRDQPDLWKESYRFRVIVEGIFSSIKRKQVNYLRAREDISRDNELLLKCLIHNLCSVGRYI